MINFDSFQIRFEDEFLKVGVGGDGPCLVGAGTDNGMCGQDVVWFKPGTDEHLCDKHADMAWDAMRNRYWDLGKAWGKDIVEFAHKGVPVCVRLTTGHQLPGHLDLQDSNWMVVHHDKMRTVVARDHVVSVRQQIPGLD